MEASPGFPVPARPASPRQDGEGRGELIGKDRTIRDREDPGGDFGQVWSRTAGPDSPGPAKPTPAEPVRGDARSFQPTDADSDPAAAGLPVPQLMPDPLLRLSPLPPVTTDAMPAASEMGFERTNGSISAPGFLQPAARTLPRVPLPTATPVGADSLPSRNEASPAPATTVRVPNIPTQAPLQPSLAGATPPGMTAAPPEDATDAAAKVLMDPKPAEFAASVGMGTAGRNPVATRISKPETFLNVDGQSFKDTNPVDGIADALSGIRMRRPQEYPTPSIAPSGGRSWLTDGLPGLASGQGGVRPTLNLSPGRELGKVEGLPLVDRAGLGVYSTESGATAPVTTTASTSSISGSRQADTVAVLENIHRLAEQAVAQGQNRLSMSLRLDDGGRVRIRLVRDGGEIRTLLNTDVPGLEAAFRQQWAQFSQEAGERGLKFQTPSFAEPDRSPAEDFSSHEGDRETTAFNRESNSAAFPLQAGSVGNGKGRQPVEMNPDPVAMNGTGHLRAWV